MVPLTETLLGILSKKWKTAKKIVKKLCKCDAWIWAESGFVDSPKEWVGDERYYSLAKSHYGEDTTNLCGFHLFGTLGPAKIKIKFDNVILSGGDSIITISVL